MKPMVARFTISKFDLEVQTVDTVTDTTDGGGGGDGDGDGVWLVVVIQLFNFHFGKLNSMVNTNTSNCVKIKVTLKQHPSMYTRRERERERERSTIQLLLNAMVNIYIYIHIYTQIHPWVSSTWVNLSRTIFEFVIKKSTLTEEEMASCVDVSLQVTSHDRHDLHPAHSPRHGSLCLCIYVYLDGQIYLYRQSFVVYSNTGHRVTQGKETQSTGTNVYTPVSNIACWSTSIAKWMYTCSLLLTLFGQFNKWPSGQSSTSTQPFTSASASSACFFIDTTSVDTKVSNCRLGVSVLWTCLVTGITSVNEWPTPNAMDTRTLQ